MSFDSFIEELERSGWPDATCLTAQIAITIFTAINIRKNFNRFPIKQLSPVCTLAALASFLLINIISVIGRQIQQINEYYDFNNCQGQCRIYDRPLMQFLALFYSGLRDFPLLVFALKTVRVSICFLDKQPPKWVITILKTELRILALSFLYILTIIVVSLIDIQVMGSMSATSAQLTFEFLCPKESGVLDWITTIFRYLLLFISYTLSIKTYKELDFKKFIFLIFLLSNTQILLRAVLVFNNRIEVSSYHEFYYHSLILHLLGTLLLLPYSNFNLNVNQPPGSAVLQNFQAFINYIPGRDILRCFALYKDGEEETTKYSECFEACLAVRKIKMEVALQSSLIKQRRSEINQLLGKSQVVDHIELSNDIRQKIANQTVQLSDIKKLQRQLIEFCEMEIFRHWKKTQSRQYIELEFKRNMIIDQKMKEMGVQIGA